MGETSKAGVDRRSLSIRILPVTMMLLWVGGVDANPGLIGTRHGSCIVCCIRLIMCDVRLKSSRRHAIRPLGNVRYT